MKIDISPSAYELGFDSVLFERAREKTFSSLSWSLCTSSSSNLLSGKESNLSNADFSDDDARLPVKHQLVISNSGRPCDSAGIERYSFEKVIGSGSFGMVVEAVDAQGNRVAIKIVALDSIEKSRYCVDPLDGFRCPLEFAILKYLPPHPNIIRRIHDWSDETYSYLVTNKAGFPWLDFDYKNTSAAQFDTRGSLGEVPTSKNDCSLASLVKFLSGMLSTRNYDSSQQKSIKNLLRKPVVPERILAKILGQVVSALEFMHEHEICHRDIKLENVLVSEKFEVQLADFGHASFFSADRSQGFYTRYGTKLFQPPEVRSNLKFFGPEGDIYALGLMMYECCNGQLPSNLESAFYRPGGFCIFDFSPNAGFCNSTMADLCQKMLSPDPAYRAGTDDILGHTWLRKFH